MPGLLNRTRVRRVAAPIPPKHGTTTGYRRHGCRCDACRKAVIDCQRAWRRGLSAVPVASHGVYGYNIRRCRCSVCRAAKAACRTAGKARPVNGVEARHEDEDEAVLWRSRAGFDYPSDRGTL